MKNGRFPFADGIACDLLGIRQQSDAEGFFVFLTGKGLPLLFELS